MTSFLAIFFSREKELKEILDLIPGTIEFRMRQLEESARNVSLNQKIPECPVKYFIWNLEYFNKSEIE